MSSENQSSADNQQERLGFNKVQVSSETNTPSAINAETIIQAYLFGAMHDGTIRHSDHRYRIAQKGVEWLKVIQRLLAELGYRSWIYQEGKKRSVYVLESVAPIFRGSFDPYAMGHTETKKAYIRGFFDAEGGIPRSLTSKRYIQLVQKDYRKIELLKSLLNEFGISTGKIHNPSVKVDPDYWRIFVRLPAIPIFVSQIGSWHPRKRTIFEEWLKIESMPYSDIGNNMNKASLGEPGDGSPPF